MNTLHRRCPVDLEHNNLEFIAECQLCTVDISIDNVQSMRDASTIVHCHRRPRLLNGMLIPKKSFNPDAPRQNETLDATEGIPAQIYV